MFFFFFSQERVELCRPGHFIITPGKLFMKLSQGSWWGVGGRSAFIISLSHYCQNMLYFTFCSREKFTFSDTIVLSSCLHPHLNVEHLGGARIFTGLWVCPGFALWWQHAGSKCNQMQIFISSIEPLANNQGLLFWSRIWACAALFPGWKRAKETLAEQIWL